MLEQPTIVSRLKFSRSLVFGFMQLSVIAMVIFAIVVDPQSLLAHLQGLGFAGLVVALGIPLLLLEIRYWFLVFYQLAFHDRAAIWLTDDRLVFLHRSYLSIELKQIKDVTLFEQWMVIRTNRYAMVNLVGGGNKKIRLILAEEPADYVVERLNELIPPVRGYVEEAKDFPTYLRR